MKIALLAARSDIHTVRWVNALAERGHNVHLLSSHLGGDAIDNQVCFHSLPFSAPAGYFLNVPRVRRLLSWIQPDLLHAHFASGYGTLGRLSGFHPLVLSVWGQDVYEFPCRSWVHRKLLTANLKAADHVCSTSHAMAEQTRSLYSGIDELTVTPFGIDVSRFRPDPSQRCFDLLTIGTVKKLYASYGIDVLIRAFAEARAHFQNAQPELARQLRLLVVGGGPEREKLQALSDELGVEEVTSFTGPVPHAKVPSYLNRLDIYAAMSRSESFGVAILEASACEIPVVVSDAGGLPEVVEEKVTGLIVDQEDQKAAAEALVQLANDPALRAKMGRAGRQRVLEHYEWEKNVSTMEKKVYARVISQAAQSTVQDKSERV